jgi:aspartate kinase
MIVMKFGGSSVSDADRIRGVYEIVKRYAAEKPVVVCSAIRGITDDLIKLAHESVTGTTGLFERIQERHFQVIDALGLDRGLIKDNLAELSVLIKGISLVKELTPRTLDYVASFGERLSCRIIAAAFTKAGLPTEEHDAFEIGMITDDKFGAANPLPEAEMELKRNLTKMTKIPLVTGYIGKTKSGDITTLGRNGSDYTATILGAAVQAKEVQVWTDVDGIMTADPNIAKSAKTIETLSFGEASELAYYGGKLAHPFTILPAIRKNIPVRVLNTFKPDHPGTKILANVPDGRKGVKSIAYKRHQIIINLESTLMLMGHGFLSRIFDTFARHEIVINMVSTSEVSVSVTTDSPKNLEKAIGDLSKEFEVTVEKDKTIMCVVGDGIKYTPGIAGDVFSALKDAGVNSLMISQGASKINLAFVINTEDVPTAIRALHQKFFGC